MAHVLDAGELTTQRLQRQWSKTRLFVPESHTIYTALLNGVPASNDLAVQITVDTEAGTLSDVLPDMALYIGTTAGGYDLGICRIRKTPITGTFYIAETSEVVWQDNAFLTVVDDYQLWAKPLRIVSQVPYMDWDIAYTDQHEDFDPVPAMGCDAIAKLSGGVANVLLGPADDTPAWVIDSTIVSQVWTIEGALSIDDNTLVNPTATFDAVGTYLAYCEFTADNGKTYTGVRYVIIWDDNNPGFKNFQIRNGRSNYESGGYSFDVTLFSEFETINLRKRSKVIIYTQDFAYNTAVTMPGQIPGRERNLCTGWISNIDTSRQSEFGEISFTVESAEYWMKKIRDYPSGLELKIGTAARWTDMPAMTVDRALWHFLHWRSTATRIMDIQLTDNDLLATRFATARANLWERMIEVCQPTIFALPAVDNFGRLFVTIEPQMVPVGDRTWPVVMILTDDDIEDEITWHRRDVNEVSMLFFSGINVNNSGKASSFFSMSPGHSYGHYGEEEAQDNYLVAGQSNANELCGLYYGWRNNDPYDLQVNFAHSMRILGMWPRQKYYYEVSPANDPRGIGFAKNFIVREINFSQDADTGFIAYSALLEPECVAGPAINGDVPGMDGIDFSVPDFGNIGALPSLPALPFIVLPPTEENPNQPKKVIISDGSIYQYGLLYTTNFNQSSADVVWLSMNNGLTLAERAGVIKIVVCPSGAIFIFTDDGAGRKIFSTTGLGGAWNLIADGVTLGGQIAAMGVNPSNNEQIAFVAGVNSLLTFYTANRTGYTVGYGTFFNNPGFISDIVFSSGAWLIAWSRSGVFAEPWLNSVSADGGTPGTDSSLFTVVGQDAASRFMISPGMQDKTFQWDSAAPGGYNELTVEGSIVTRITTLNPAHNGQGMAFSPAGLYAMASDSSVFLTPYKTTDAGATWSSVAGTIPVGSDIWENCRDNNRWIFGGGIIIRLTMDQGATYEDKLGNLLQTAALCDITNIRFIE